MSNNKLLKVMDYLINEQEDKARELLHQLFIEKARAIHEELMSEDDMEEETLGGDKGLGLGDEIRSDIEEVENEEHYGDGTMEDVDLDDAVDDLSDELGDDEDEVDVADHDDEEDMDADAEEMDHDEEDMDADAEEMDHDEESQEERISDLEQEIEELKALYADLNDGGTHHEEEGEEEEGVDENWMDETDDLEEWDDLEESLDLETVAVNAKKAAEVGSGKFARPEANTKSAVASNAPNMNGAKPVVTKSKNHSGYGMESAPTSGDMKLGDNRRKKSTQDTSHVSKEGSTKALINKDRSEGFGAPNQKSPIGSGTTPKK